MGSLAWIEVILEVVVRVRSFMDWSAEHVAALKFTKYKHQDQ